MLHTFLMIIHFFCAAAIVSLVLLQRGKGADAGAGFGAGASGTVFGARGASTALSRTTAILAAIFMVTSLSLAYVGAKKSTTSGGDLLDQFTQPKTPAIPVPGTGGAVLQQVPLNQPQPSGSQTPPAAQLPPASGGETAPSAAPATVPPANLPPAQK